MVEFEGKVGGRAEDGFKASSLEVQEASDTKDCSLSSRRLCLRHLRGGQQRLSRQLGTGAEGRLRSPVKALTYWWSEGIHSRRGKGVGRGQGCVSF